MNNGGEKMNKFDGFFRKTAVLAAAAFLVFSWIVPYSVNAEDEQSQTDAVTEKMETSVQAEETQSSAPTEEPEISAEPLTEITDPAEQDIGSSPAADNTETENVDVSVLYLGESNVWEADNYNFSSSDSGKTLKELGIVLPEMVSGEGFTQRGWMDSNGMPVTEDTVIESGHTAIYPNFDKMLYPFLFEYLDKDGNYKEASHVFTFDHYADKEEVMAAVNQYRPADASEEYELTGWDVEFNVSDTADIIVYTTNYATAEYGDYMILLVSESYLMTDGLFNLEKSNSAVTRPLMVSNGTSAQEVIDQLQKTSVRETVDGVQFTGWKITLEHEDLQNGDMIFMDAEYDQIVFRTIVMGSSDQESDTILSFSYSIVRQGDVFTFPETITGIDNLSWVYSSENNEITVDETYTPGVYTFYGTGIKNEDYTEGGMPSAPAEDHSSSAVSEIAAAEEGSSVYVEMGQNTVVPEKVLSAAKGKDVNVVLNMGDYTWTINGKDITAETLKDINLEVKLDTDAIPAEAIKNLAGDNPVKQLELTYSGEFGFKAELTLNVGSENNGKFGNLYYYNDEGRMIFIDAGQIGSDGTVSLTFSHASDYVIVISDTKHSSGSHDPETGVTDSAAPYAAAIILCFAAGMLTLRRKRIS